MVNQLAVATGKCKLSLPGMRRSKTKMLWHSERIFQAIRRPCLVNEMWINGKWEQRGWLERKQIKTMVIMMLVHRGRRTSRELCCEQHAQLSRRTDAIIVNTFQVAIVNRLHVSPKSVTLMMRTRTWLGFQLSNTFDINCFSKLCWSWRVDWLN